MERRTHDGANTETETVLPYGSNDLTHLEMQEVLSEICTRLRVSVVRTNATKRGYVELQVRDDPPLPPSAPPAADLAAAQQEIARLRAALERAVSFVEHAEVSSGVCCCGDDMDRHANLMDCGHSPRDMWDYAAEGFIKETRALLDTK